MLCLPVPTKLNTAFFTVSALNISHSSLCSTTGKTKAVVCTIMSVGNINVLFNDTLNTFDLRIYGVRHMVKDHSDSEKG